jgi:spore maturation protein SpmB
MSSYGIFGYCVSAFLPLGLLEAKGVLNFVFQSFTQVMRIIQIHVDIKYPLKDTKGCSRKL